MQNIILIILLILFIGFLLLFPFTIKIYNEESFLFINICGFLNLKLSLLALLSDINNLDFKKQKKNLKYIKNIKLKEVDIKLEGLNLSYQVSGIYYGIMHAIFGLFNSVLHLNGVKFKYDLKYGGEQILKFNSVVRGSAFNVIRAFLKI